MMWSRFLEHPVAYTFVMLAFYWTCYLIWRHFHPRPITYTRVDVKKATVKAFLDTGDVLTAGPFYGRVWTNSEVGAKHEVLPGTMYAKEFIDGKKPLKHEKGISIPRHRVRHYATEVTEHLVDVPSTNRYYMDDEVIEQGIV